MRNQFDPKVLYCRSEHLKHVVEQSGLAYDRPLRIHVPGTFTSDLQFLTLPLCTLFLRIAPRDPETFRMTICMPDI